MKLNSMLEDLLDDANPNFVEEVVTSFYGASDGLIHSIKQPLESNPLDFNRPEAHMHQFKGSSSSIGARRVKSECTQFGEYCNARNAEGYAHNQTTQSIASIPVR
ncbi:Signal transduction histidine kinase, phosphotransfer (Hpt) domain [Dillenia turbinata]|uniref:Histidine-containing phosphotransfer protein n=1 Tax=Dillenia turbinata TaxID=194707 RepID=A0AAN8V7M6_9MAGN